MGPEAKIEAYFKKRVEELGGICWKLTSPGRRGVPDRLVTLPMMGMFCVELKSEVGRLSRHQIQCFEDLANAGGEVITLSSRAEVDELMDYAEEMDTCDCAVCVARRNKRGMH